MTLELLAELRMSVRGEAELRRWKGAGDESFTAAPARQAVGASSVRTAAFGRELGGEAVLEPAARQQPPVGARQRALEAARAEAAAHRREIEAMRAERATETGAGKEEKCLGR